MTKSSLPIVGVVCDREIIGPHPFHVTGDKYIQAIVSGSHCLPILIPALADISAVNQLLEMVDGILLTGGYSMVDPLHYQVEPADADTKLDRLRDNTSFPLIKGAIEQGVPIFGICRGFQEMNVALGGSLFQQLHTQGQYFEHRENKMLPTDKQYASSHDINLTAGGQLENILKESSIKVNSLHTQGLDRLARNLSIEAVSTDGLVEAISVADAKSFAIAVQWHPEWMVQQNKHSLKLFNAFGQACAMKKAMKEASLRNE